MVVKMIDDQKKKLGLVMHETKALMVIIGSHNSKVVFNVISSLTNLIIIGLSWFILHNPQVDWKTKNLHFESINKTTPKYKAFLISMLDSKYDSTRKDIVKISQHMQKLKCEGDIGGNQGSNHFKPLFVGARTCMQASKKGDAFFVYAIPAPDPKTQQHNIPIQY